MRAARSFVVLLGLAGLSLTGWASGCGTFYDDCHNDPAVCIAFAGGDGGNSTSTTTGDGGGPICAKDSECPDGNPCTDDVCNQGKCENPPNDTVEPTDTNPCTDDVCKNGVASHPFSAAGKACAMSQCNGAGVCTCTSNDQCGMSTDCVKVSCDPTKGCVLELPTDPLPDPTPNDCKGIKCDGMGHVVAYSEDNDKPLDDGVVCTDDVCMNGVGSHPASAEGSACMGSNVCKAAGTCVFCTDSFGCNVAGGEYCFNEAACANCTNAVLDGDESDLGCGGTHCPKCADGKNCGSPADCASGNCNSGKCVSCSDTLQNGSETDVDCGGSCPKCADGKICSGNNDCTSGKCSGNKCVSCTDGIKNGGESDIDCGGSCPKCTQGKACSAGGDCTTTFCAEGVCCGSACGGTCLSCNLPGKVGSCTVVPAGLPDPGTCGGGMLCNGDGGGTCSANGGKKAIGDACLQDSDCFNNTCQGVCKLKVADPCAVNADCQTFLCTNNVCTSCATSNDCPGMLAGSCVGGKCKLPAGEPCKVNSDCLSNSCGNNPKKCM